MTEAVSLGELLHEEALFGLTGASERWEYPLRRGSGDIAFNDLFPSGENRCIH